MSSQKLFEECLKRNLNEISKLLEKGDIDANSKTNLF